MTHNKKRVPNIIFIVGQGASGSTLLSLILNSHSHLTTAGEIDCLPTHSNTTDKQCSCHQPLRICKFWQPILEKQSFFGLDQLAPKIRVKEILPSSFRQTEVDCTNFIKQNSQIFQSVSRTSGCTQIVDASKGIVRWYLLHKYFSKQLTTIYIIRDGRAFINSKRKRLRLTNWTNKFRWTLIGLPKCIFDWIKVNWGIVKILKREAKDKEVLTITYEELTEKPEKTLQKICNHLEIQYQPKMLEYYYVPHHHVAGNPSKFNPGPITPRHEWVNNLNWWEKLIFALMGGHYWNKRFRNFRNLP